jgi:hypothetical protein
MPIRHPFDAATSYSVEEASRWLTENGLPTAVGSLNSMRTKGYGPAWFKIGKYVYYTESALRQWLMYKLSPEVRSTSELRAVKQLQIEPPKDEAAE